ncbi:MAG: cyclopropane fatty acyl phospholipid synthase [Candidatus Paceibacterota bacterium]
MANEAKKWISKLIAPTGITVNGSNPWDIEVLNEDLYGRILSQGSLGLGEAYMDGWWDCDKLDEFFYRVLSNKLEERIGISLPLVWNYLRSNLFNMQSISKAYEVGERHYDTGNDLFIAMLGKTMAYSCGYWKKANNLDQAQEAKMDLICRKLNLQPGQRILDIGCGWGSFAKYAAKNYKVRVVGVTVSKEQVQLAEELCKGLPVEFRLEDYRDLNEKFDHIVSVGMIEHVGHKNYKEYMEVAKRCLKDNGLFLLHTIGSLRSVSGTDPWTNKYIFPNGMLPSLKQISSAAEGLFVIEDLHNFGADYDKTLMAWHKNFEASWPELQQNYGNRFYRMWRYYLLSCAAAFRARSIQLWQIVLSPNGVPGGYNSIR